MKTREIQLKYGNTVADTLEMGAGSVLTELKIKHIATLQRPEEIIQQALDKPIGSHPFNETFRGAGEALIIIPDKSRRSGSEVYLPILRKRLNQLGISDNNLTILVANGGHPASSETDLSDFLSNESIGGIKIVQHDCRNSKELTYVGETKRGTPILVNKLVADAEHIILCGAMTHHYFAGYGGGPKMIMPGCAGYDSITRNHALAIDKEQLRLHEGCRDGKIEGNPVQEDLREAFKFINVSFLLHTILNGHDNIIGAVAGEPLQAHAAGCRIIDDIYRVPIAEQADLVIVSCGGHPRDINYIQAHKALHRAFYAARPGGVIILLAKCAEGIGSSTFMEWFDYDSPEKLHHALVHNFKLNGTTALATMQKARECRVLAVTDLPREIVDKLGFTPFGSLQEAWREAFRELLPFHICRTYVIPNGALAVPMLVQADNSVSVDSSLRSGIQPIG